MVFSAVMAAAAWQLGFGTYAGAQYTASRIAGAKFIGFERGGHLLVGHDAAVRTAIVELLDGASVR